MGHRAPGVSRFLRVDRGQLWVRCAKPLVQIPWVNPFGCSRT